MTSTKEAYIPGFRNDIFISYASVNNQPRSGEDPNSGWISTLVNDLRISVDEALGRTGSCSIWKDNRLLPGACLTDEITDSLQNSAIFLMFLSTGYLESEWCKKEKDIFLKALDSRGRDLSNIIIIEKNRLEDKDVPGEFKDFKRAPFWIADDDSLRSRTLRDRDLDFGKNVYWDRINDIVTALSGKIKNLKEQYDTQLASSAATTSQLQQNNHKATIFLAEATDDLGPHREEVKRYLDQQNFHVLPDNYYPPGPQEYKDALAEDLKHSTLFVQLLSNVAGKRFQGVEKGYNHLQYERARNLQIPAMQWFTPDQKIETVADNIQRELAEQETVMQTNLQNFKKAVVRKTNEIIKMAEEDARPKPAITSILSVFVNTSTHDIDLARQVEKIVAKKNMMCMLPVNGGSSEEVREDLEGNIVSCDAIILIYGKDTLIWVRKQLRNLPRVLWKRPKGIPLRAFAVYDGPPADKEDININMPGMEIIDCRRGLNEAKVNGFLDLLKGNDNE